MPNNVIYFDSAKRSMAKNAQPSSQEQEKHSLFSNWLSQGTVMVTFLTEHPMVEIPIELKDKPMLSLNFSYNFQVSDFSFNQKAVWGTLSFANGEHFCRVPWTAIIAMHSKN